MSRPLWLRCGAAAALALLIVSAGHVVQAQRSNMTRRCIERFDPAADYFPEKAILEDAAMFHVEYRHYSDIKLLQIPDLLLYHHHHLPDHHVNMFVATEEPCHRHII